MNAKKIVVLGAGNIGAYIAFNLADDYEVIVADNSIDALEKVSSKIDKIKSDLSNHQNISKIINNSDLVVSALPEAFGYEALNAIINAKKDVVDISFWEQDKAKISEADNLAQQQRVTAFIDSGIAPGFSNATVAYFDKKLDHKTKNAKIYVGGIPKDKNREFFAPWSVSGLMEEYQRPALLVRKGRMKKVPCLSLTEELFFQNVGIVEAAVTDGLRSIPYYLDHVDNMAEFTLRYPGHFSQMKMLKELGYFSEVPLEKGTAYDLSQKLLENSRNNQEYEKMLQELGFYDKTIIYENISPRSIAADVLSKTWKMRQEDRDILIMRIQADDGQTAYSADVSAEHDGSYSAMALSTGGVAALSARIILENMFNEKGMYPLERLINERPDLMDYFVKGLKNLGINIYGLNPIEFS